MREKSTQASIRSSRRTTGLLLATAFVLIAAGVIMYVAIGHGSSQPAAPLPGNVVDIGRAPAVQGSAAQGQNDLSQIQETGAARLQFVDKSDSSRISSELAYDKLDPVGTGYYALAQPRAWIYLKDGRTMHIRADAGRVKMPTRTQQPESGEFTGNVLVRLFAPKPSGSLISPIDPERDAPAMLASTASVSFDTALLELSTPDSVTISTPGLLFEGDSLIVRGNQVRQRLELLKTKGKFLRYNPELRTPKPEAFATSTPAPVKAAAPAASAPPSTPAVASSSDQANTPAPAAAVVASPREQMYRAIVSDGVDVLQDQRALESDTLEIFVRLINDRLPEDAFGPAIKSADNAAPVRSVTPAYSSPAPVGPFVTLAQTPSPSKAMSAQAPATDAHAMSHANGASRPASPVATKPAQAEGPAPIVTAGKSLFQSAGKADIVLNWSGSLVLTPVGDKAEVPELSSGNHFAARFSADKPGGRSKVKLSDRATGTRGECAQIEFAGTSRMLALNSGTDAPLVLVDSPDGGRLEFPSVRINVATGLAHVPGPGLLASIKPGDRPSPAPAAEPQEPLVATLPATTSAAIPDNQARQISWSDQADFQFRSENGKMTSALDWASFTGKVRARDRSSIISGDFLRAQFMPLGKQASAIKKLYVEGNVLGVAGPRATDPDAAQPSLDPYIACQTLDVVFAPSRLDPLDSDPVRARAVGAVKAASKDASLRCKELDVVMVRDDTRQIVVTDLAAEGEVLFEKSDGITARADSLRASPVTRIADLTGKLVALARGASTILCTQARLDDVVGSLQVFGAGTLEHLQVDPNTLIVPGATDNPRAVTSSADATRIIASWNKSMFFNNSKGTVEASGDTSVVASSALATQTLRSERLMLWLTPGVSNAAPETAKSSESAALAAPAAPSAPTPDGKFVLGDGRKLLKAEALSESLEVEGGKFASVEVRRYAPPTGTQTERSLEQIMFMEGPKIVADEVQGTIRVPAGGRGIVRDQRQVVAGLAEAPPTGLGVVPTTSKGTSRFTWAESLVFTRNTGVLTMLKDVELVHLPMGSNQVTRLVAMKLDATFNTYASGATTNSSVPRSAELVKAEATGTVYAESGQQRLLADVFAYDALAGTALASALDGNRVTFYDDRKGSPLVAKKLFWDLARERVEITEPSPVTSPR